MFLNITGYRLLFYIHNTLIFCDFIENGISFLYSNLKLHYQNKVFKINRRIIEVNLYSTYRLD